MIRIKMYISKAKLPFYPSCEIKCGLQNRVSTIAHNDVFHELTKHIEIDYHITRQHLKKGNLQLFFISSIDQPVDIFTKTHPPVRLQDLISKLQLASSLPPQVFKRGYQYIAQFSLAHQAQPTMLYLQYTHITCTSHILNLYKALYYTMLFTQNIH